MFFEKVEFSNREKREGWYDVLKFFLKNKYKFANFKNYCYLCKLKFKTYGYKTFLRR